MLAKIRQSKELQLEDISLNIDLKTDLNLKALDLSTRVLKDKSLLVKSKMDLKQKSGHLDYSLDMAMSSFEKIKIFKKKGLKKRFSSLLTLKASVDHDKNQVQEVDDWLNKTRC